MSPRSEQRIAGVQPGVCRSHVFFFSILRVKQPMAWQEHLVDRRLVTSMLALYHDHVSSGQRALAEQVLNQTLQILGALGARVSLGLQKRLFQPSWELKSLQYVVWVCP